MLTTEPKESTSPVLVTGATGKQGGAVARALLAAGTPVRALVRTPTAQAALHLQSLGAELVQGDLDFPERLESALANVRAVFSIQTPDINDLGSDIEMVRGRHLVEAAQTAGITQFVHTSVQGAGDFQQQAPGWAEGRWNRHYWESKAYIDDLVRSAGFASWTVLKPATFMENLIGWSFIFGNWAQDGFTLAVNSDTKLALVALQDIGAAAAYAFHHPETLHGKDVELAGDYLTVSEMAHTLEQHLGQSFPVHLLSPDDALKQGLHPMVVNIHEHLAVVGTPARPEEAQSLGLPTTTFDTWTGLVLKPIMQGMH